MALMMAADGNDGGIARCDEGPRNEIEDSDERKQYLIMPSDTYTILEISFRTTGKKSLYLGLE